MDELKVRSRVIKGQITKNLKKFNSLSSTITAPEVDFFINTLTQAGDEIQMVFKQMAQL